jgi:hypothetical protein
MRPNCQPHGSQQMPQTLSSKHYSGFSSCTSPINDVGLCHALFSPYSHQFGPFCKLGLQDCLQQDISRSLALLWLLFLHFPYQQCWAMSCSLFSIPSLVWAFCQPGLQDCLQQDISYSLPSQWPPHTQWLAGHQRTPTLAVLPYRSSSTSSALASFGSNCCGTISSHVSIPASPQPRLLGY